MGGGWGIFGAQALYALRSRHIEIIINRSYYVYTMHQMSIRISFVKNVKIVIFGLCISHGSMTSPSECIALNYDLMLECSTDL